MIIQRSGGDPEPAKYLPQVDPRKLLDEAEQDRSPWSGSLRRSWANFCIGGIRAWTDAHPLLKGGREQEGDPTHFEERPVQHKSEHRHSPKEEGG